MTVVSPLNEKELLPFLEKITALYWHIAPKFASSPAEKA